MRKVILSESADHRITASFEEMQNGELRFRLMDGDRNGYIRTIAGHGGGWQNSHHHASAFETYIVERGWIAVATLENGELKIRICEPGGVFTIPPGIAHNLYLCRELTIHTVKHGSVGAGPDWISDKVLDEMTHAIVRESDVQRIATNCAPENCTRLEPAERGQV